MIGEELSLDKELSYCEADLLCYFLHILGEGALVALLKGFSRPTLKRISTFYQKFDLKDQVIGLVEPLLE